MSEAVPAVPQERRTNAGHCSLRKRDYCFAVGFAERLRGLIGREREMHGGAHLVFVGCSCIHTFFMRVCIDVAFADERGHVLKVWQRLEPGRIVFCKGAKVTVERIAQVPEPGSGWYEVGDRIVLCGAGELPRKCVQAVERGGGKA